MESCATACGACNEASAASALRGLWPTTARIETLLDQSLIAGHGPVTGDRLRPGLQDRHHGPPERAQLRGSACFGQISAEAVRTTVRPNRCVISATPPLHKPRRATYPKARPLQRPDRDRSWGWLFHHPDQNPFGPFVLPFHVDFARCLRLRMGLLAGAALIAVAFAADGVPDPDNAGRLRRRRTLI